MRTVFADAFYYLAFISEDDAAHERAIQFSKNYTGRTLTTAWVLTEVADALAKPQQRSHAVALLAQLRADPALTIVPASNDLFDRGLELYAARPDKAWSLTDCISFVAMTDHQIAEALTGDHHFPQAGFLALLK